MINSTHYFRDQISRRWGLFTLLVYLLAWGSLSAQAQESFFEPVSAAQGRLAANTRSIPNAKLYKLNETGLRSALVNTAKQYERGKAAATIALPLPDGTTELFSIRETQVLSPALAAENPTIKTYEGEGTVHKGYIIRMSLSSIGFEALIWGVGNDAVYFVRTKAESGGDLYQSYYARDARKAGAVNSPIGDHHCDVIENTDKMELPGLKVDGKGLRVGAGVNQISNGTSVRQFKIAIATTGEWSRNAAGYDGTQTPLQIRQAAFPVVVTAVNRINGIYERELACRFQITNPALATDQTNIIFDNPVTDPYSNTDTAGELTANQTTLDNRVGTANYDVGHLFGTEGGGVATSPSLCAAGFKAQGYSAREGNNGDPFVVDYFAHELGHQFNMKHTYNVINQGGACTTRSADEAYEVASGSTIMSYVGICRFGRDLQEYNDFALPSFHISSITKATQEIAFVAADGCGVDLNRPNAIPTVSAGSAYTIPRLTPFTLTAAGADADAGDVANLSYSWEEFDLAPASGATGFGGTPSGVYDIDDDGVARPILRPYSPVKSPQRTFPSAAFILNPQNNATPGENQPGLFYTGTHPTGFPGATCPTGQTCLIGERLPTIARTMNFRVSVRDLRGGVVDAGTVVTVVNTPGAFRLTSFDNASTVAGNSQQTVTWNVVNTNQAPINCANVAIKLSTDGGLTFPTTLLASTANDGSELVMMPNVASSTARLRVEAVDNIFFDISNTNFTITPVTATAPVATTNADQTATVQTAFSYTVNAFTGTTPITYSASGLPAGLMFNADTRVISGTPTTAGNSVVTITGTNSAGQASTMFAITVSPAATAPVATANSNQTAFVQTPFSYTVNAFTGSQPITYTAFGLPAGLTFDADTRVISGTPTTPGLRGVSILGANSAGQDNTSFAIDVREATPPTDVFSITAVTTVSCVPVAGDPNRRSLTFNPQYSGANGQPISFSVVNELRPTTAPGPYTLGVYVDKPTITLSAIQTGTAGEATFVYNWLANCGTTPPANTAPTVANAIPNQSATAGTAFSYMIPANTFTDAETPNQLTLSVSGLPAGLMFTAPATISGTPSMSGTSMVTVSATDPGGLSASTMFALTVNPAGTPNPTGPFAITGVTTVSCTPVAGDPNRRSLTFNPQYSGANGQPISFSVVNELRPTTAPGPYTLGVYVDKATITLSATQNGTAGEATFVYNWLATCGTTPTPDPTAAFAITAVTTVSCVPVAGDPNRRSLTFNPQYSGANGQPISFSVVNELRPTTAPGPYTLGVYIDKPTITLSAKQSGTAGEATFVYNWLANCNTGTAQSRAARESGDEAPLTVRVLGNPVVDGRVQVEVTGAAGQPLQLMLTDMRGTVIYTHRVEQPAALEMHSFDIGRQPVSTLLLRVATPTQVKTVTLLKVE